MKYHVITISFIFILVILVFSLLTYQVFSYYREPIETVDHNPIITLIFPDQQYVISSRDLKSIDFELVIPTRDNPTTKIIYNKELGKLESIISPQDYVINVVSLRTQIDPLGNDSISIVPTYSLRDRNTTGLTEFNQHLNQVYRSPLSISIKDGSDMAEIVLDPALIRSLMRPLSTDLIYPLDLDKVTLINYITKLLTPKQKKYFNANVAYQNTKNAFNLRFMSNETPIVLGIDDGPSSHGELAGKYLEVDLSQQKMYFFIDKTLYKEYKISTGFEYPTPVGEYHILNKEPLAFSSIYNVWMPYWMAFKYAGDVGAYLGLHEIAYAKDPKGKQVYKYGYYIGDMMTGGCVAMEPKDSREIYNFSDVGMLVRIVK